MSVPSAVHPVRAIVTREPRPHPEYRRNRGRVGDTGRVVDDNSGASGAFPDAGAAPGPGAAGPGASYDPGAGTGPGSSASGPADLGAATLRGRGTRRQAAALRDLVDTGVLTEDQRDAVLAALAEPDARPSRAKVLAEIAAYTGAGLLLAGISLVLAASWEDLARTGRVVVLALITVVVAMIGVTVAGGPAGLFPSTRGRGRTGDRIRIPASRTRLAAVLFALTAALVAGTVGTAIEDGNTDSAWVYACITGLIAAVIGYLALPSLLGILVCAVLSAAVVSGVITDFAGLREGWPGFGILLLGLGWALLTRFGAFEERWAGYLVAVLFAIYGAQSSGDYESMVLAYWLTALVALLCFTGYLTDRSWVLVLGGAVALALAAAEAVCDWTDGSVGAAGAVLIVGALVLGAGGYLLTRAGHSSG